MARAAMRRAHPELLRAGLRVTLLAVSPAPAIYVTEIRPPPPCDTSDLQGISAGLSIDPGPPASTGSERSGHVPDEQRSAGNDTAADDRPLQRAPRRRHRSTGADEAGALEREGSGVHCLA